MASAATAPPHLLVLPDPLYLADPPLYSRLTHAIQNTLGLTEPDRLVLIGVLQHTPFLSASTTALVDRLLSLDPPQIKTLADLFLAGLLDARSWGGRRKTACSRGVSNRSLPSTAGATPATPGGEAETLVNMGYSEIFSCLAIPPFPRRASATPTPTPTLTGTGALSPLPPPSLRRSEACLERQNWCCPLTTRADIALETAHLIPHSVAALASSESAFWLLLAICLGPDLRDHLYALIHGANSYSTTNGLVIDSTMHKYYDKGVFVLVPAPEPGFDATVSRHLDVCFRWRYAVDNLHTCFTMLPVAPEDQVATTQKGASVQAHAGKARQIHDGDIFRLFTDDPGKLPLPHPFLLSLHAVLWRMIGSAGLAETGQHKRKRAGSGRAAGPDGSGDDDDDNDGGDIVERTVKRVSRRNRMKREGGGEDGGRPPYQPGISGSTKQHADQPTTQADKPLSISDGLDALEHSPSTSVDSGRKSGVREMTFLEKEYLAFRLRQIEDGEGWSSEYNYSCGEGDSETDDLSDDSSNYLSDESVSDDPVGGAKARLAAKPRQGEPMNTGAGVDPEEPEPGGREFDSNPVLQTM